MAVRKLRQYSTQEPLNTGPAISIRTARLTTVSLILSDGEIKNRLIKPREAADIKERLEGCLKIGDREGIKKIFKEEIRDGILIFPFDETALQAASYDLSVGKKAQSVTFARTYETVGLRLQPGEAAQIQTSEYIALPSNIAGFIHSKVTKVLDGLSHVSTKVDPGYFGYLVIAVQNNANQLLPIPSLDKLCAISFIQLKSPAINPYFIHGQHLGEKGWMAVESRLQPVKRHEKGDVTLKLMESVFETYGPPFDIVYETFALMQTQAQELFDKQMPNLKSQLMTEISAHIDRRENKLLLYLFSSVVITVVLGMLTILVSLFKK
jgi:deoxycytidine triphosphate deaminase